jgi:cytochrome b subunit of formate dehydrogenase
MFHLTDKFEKILFWIVIILIISLTTSGVTLILWNNTAYFQIGVELLVIDACLITLSTAMSIILFCCINDEYNCRCC